MGQPNDGLAPAAAAAATGNPYAMWIDAGSKVLGQALQKPPEVSSATSGGYNSLAFDNSGWNVNFGSGSVTSERTQQTTAWQQYALMALGLVVAWKVLKK